MHQQDNNKKICSLYDVVFSSDVMKWLIHKDFKKFVADTAIDGVHRVLAQDKEKISSDYKIMQNMNCKGGEPSLMTVKVEQNNPLLQNLDIDKTKTKLQKDIDKVKKDQIAKEEKAKDTQKRLAEAQSKFDNGEVGEESEQDEEDNEPKPTGIIQPKYKLVHSFPTDVGDAWGGYQTAQMEHENTMKARIPTHLTVTLFLKWCDSMKGSKLDIDESTLVFEFPELYYLDLNLKYKCDPDQGSAKFDKTKKTLTIKLPVVGLTADSQAVLDQHYQKFVVEQTTIMNNLQT